MAEDEPAVEDWNAVAAAITARLTDARLTQMDVASKARVSLTTLRELQHNLNPRRRRPQTLAAISQALGWPPEYLGLVLRGEVPQPRDEEKDDPVLEALTALKQEVQGLRIRVADLEQRLAHEDA